MGQRSFVVGAMRVAAGSELGGPRMFDLSTQTRVVAITRPDAAVTLHPRRDVRLHADDTVYLIGPYRELLSTLWKGQVPTELRGDGAEPAVDADNEESGRSSPAQPLALAPSHSAFRRSLVSSQSALVSDCHAGPVRGSTARRGPSRR